MSVGRAEPAALTPAPLLRIPDPLLRTPAPPLGTLTPSGRATSLRTLARPLRTLAPTLRPLAGAGILVALGLHLGAGPFLAGLRAVGPGSILAALGIGLLTTVFSAWRWSLVARGLGLHLPLGAAVTECYRALFLNSVLPAGVLGDVDRAVRHGRRTGELGRCARAVVLERAAGQVVLIGFAAAVLLSGPSVLLVLRDLLPGPGATAVLAGLVPAVLAGVLIGARRTLRTEPDRPALPRPSTWLPVAALSAAALAGYLTLFVLAVRTAGSGTAVGDLLPVLVLALLAMGLPANIGGWGPREAVTAAGFAGVGLGAGQGLTAAVVYGVLSFVACLPGLAVLLLRRKHTGRIHTTGHIDTREVA